MNDIPIPDLRFEQTFKRAVLKNATTAADAKHAKLKAQARARAEAKSKAKPKTKAETIDDERSSINSNNNDNNTYTADEELVEAPIPVITPGIIIQTIIKDQLIMPLVQGFGTALGLFILRPWLRVIAMNGRYYGITLVNGIKAYGSMLMYPRRRA